MLPICEIRATRVLPRKLFRTEVRTSFVFQLWIGYVNVSITRSRFVVQGIRAQGLALGVLGCSLILVYRPPRKLLPLVSFWRNHHTQRKEKAYPTGSSYPPETHIAFPPLAFRHQPITSAAAAAVVFCCALDQLLLRTFRFADDRSSMSDTAFSAAGAPQGASASSGVVKRPRLVAWSGTTPRLGGLSFLVLFIADSPVGPCSKPVREFIDLAGSVRRFLDVFEGERPV